MRLRRVNLARYRTTRERERDLEHARDAARAHLEACATCASVAEQIWQLQREVDALRPEPTTEDLLLMSITERAMCPDGLKAVHATRNAAITLANA